jgi:hypothetical protein
MFHRLVKGKVKRIRYSVFHVSMLGSLYSKWCLRHFERIKNSAYDFDENRMGLLLIECLLQRPKSPEAPTQQDKQKSKTAHAAPINARTI